MKNSKLLVLLAIMEIHSFKHKQILAHKIALSTMGQLFSMFFGDCQ